MEEQAIKLLKEIADSESFIVRDTNMDLISLDVDEERTPVDHGVFDYLLEKKFIKKLADSDNEIFYIISAEGKNYIF